MKRPTTSAKQVRCGAPSRGVPACARPGDFSGAVRIPKEPDDDQRHPFQAGQTRTAVKGWRVREAGHTRTPASGERGE